MSSGGNRDEAALDVAVGATGETPPVTNAFEAALEAVITMDGEGYVRSFNRAAEDIFGFTREQVLAKPLADFVIPPNLRAAHWSGIARLRAGGRPRFLGQRVELIAMRADGSEFPVDIRVARLSTDPLLFIGFIRDVSEHGESEERARHLQELLAFAEEATHVGTWEWSPAASGEVAWSNETYRIFGYEPGTVTPNIDLVIERTHPEDRAAMQDGIQAALAGSPPDMIEHRIIRPDGTVRTVIERLVSSVEGTGPPAGLTGTTQDVTESRAREREVEGYYAVGQALVDWEAEEGVVGLLQRLALAMDWVAAVLWTPDDDGRVIRCRGLWAAPDLAETFEKATRKLTISKGHGLPGQAWKTGEPVRIADVALDRDFVRQRHAAAAGLRHALAIPALRDHQVVAVLEFFAREPQASSPELGRMLSVVGYQLGYILERRRAALEPAMLTAREREVLAVVAEGQTSQQIAERLVISPETVKSHLRNVYAKLDVKDRAEAVAQGVRWGLIK
jgi:PAS domain S-box-containing protein